MIGTHFFGRRLVKRIFESSTGTSVD